MALGQSSIITRFAPSPTGFLHIGGARTALFNYLFARHHGGKFLLRIEDTDRERSTQAAIDAILDGMRWLDLAWDGDVVFQFSRAQRHAEVAHELLARGQAYHCYATPAELEEMREQARREGRPLRYDGRWRDKAPSEAPPGVKPVIRLKAPREGETTIQDMVQGAVMVSHEQLDDMILLRADGTPTYMLAVVVDDHDMGVTHVIRGDDHLNNAFRQLALIRAMGWPEPHYAHIPLIHGADGAKLSKRHGALGLQEYRDMGFLAEAVENYLLRLGWGHGDDEIINREQAIEWFDIDAVGRSPSRFDLKKLENLNGHYMREAPDARLTHEVTPFVEAALERPLSGDEKDMLQRAMGELKIRAKTLQELALSALFYFRSRPIPLDDNAQKLLQPAGLDVLRHVRMALAGISEWRIDVLDAAMRQLSEQLGIGLGKIAQPLRAALTGSTSSPGIFDVLHILGKDESLGRLDDILGTTNR